MTISSEASAVRSLVFLVEPAGQHRFSYAKLEASTGEAVWRWPKAPPLSDRAVVPMGQLLDVSA